MIKLLVFLMALWCLAICLIWIFQEKLLFHPEPLASNVQFDLAYTSEVYIDVPGATLHALYLHQPPEKSKGIVLFLHGNAGNLQTWFTHADFWLDTGYDVLMPDFRGFGKSTGRIENEAQLNDDILRCWKFVAENYANKKHVIYGRSLGTGLAAILADETPTDLLVLVSPYTSVTEMARKYYPWVPGFILRYPLATDQVLPNLHTKILLIHGTKDQLISIDNSKRLQKLNPNAHLVEIEGAGHADIHDFKDYTDAVTHMLKTL